MTVAELLEKLKDVPTDAHVKMAYGESGFENVDFVCWWVRDDGEKFVELS